MNKIIANIIEIEKLDSLHIVSFDFNSTVLKMMSLELNEKVKVGQKVVLAIKPMHVSFAKNLQGQLSITNFFKAKIKGINTGKLLSSATFEANYTLIESVFTTSTLKSMNLQMYDEYTILIKASDISIFEVLDD